MLDQLDDPVPFVADDAYLAAVRRRGTHLRRRRRGLRALAVLPVMALLAVAVGAAWLDHRTDQVDRVEVAAGVLAPVVDGEPYNILVVGTDADAPSGGGGVRSDTQMIVRVDRAAGTVRMLSLPRDLVVPGDTERLNAKLGEGGPDALITAIHQGLGIPISHYVAVDFQGFVRLVDAAGGVSVDARSEYRDQLTGTHLEPGCQHLDGAATLGLVRSRHLEHRTDATGVWEADTAGDLGRVQVQQAVMFQLLTRLKAKAGNLSTLDDLLTVFADNTTVDAGFSRADLLSLAHWGATTALGPIVMETLPVTPFTTPEGAAVLRPAPEAAAAVAGFEHGAGPPVTPQTDGVTPQPDWLTGIGPADSIISVGPCS